jgi:hypothetical protein
MIFILEQARSGVVEDNLAHILHSTLYGRAFDPKAVV